VLSGRNNHNRISSFTSSSQSYVWSLVSPKLVFGVFQSSFGKRIRSARLASIKNEKNKRAQLYVGFWFSKVPPKVFGNVLKELGDFGVSFAAFRDTRVTSWLRLCLDCLCLTALFTPSGFNLFAYELNVFPNQVQSGENAPNLRNYLLRDFDEIRSNVTHILEAKREGNEGLDGPLTTSTLPSSFPFRQARHRSIFPHTASIFFIISLAH